MNHRLRGALARRRDHFLYSIRRRPAASLARLAGCALVGLVAVSIAWVEVASRSVLDDTGPGEASFFGVDFSLDYGHWHRVRRFPLVVDATGRSVGMIPPSAIRGAPARPGYRTVDPGLVPAAWWDLVVALEDVNQDRWWHAWGIDGKGLLRAVMKGGSGGSTTTMQLAKTIKLDTDAPGFARVVRKVRDLAHAPVLRRALAHKGDDAEALWFATHVPMLHSDLHGLANAAWVLWGKAPQDLDLGEQALLAASVKWRVRLTGDDSRARRRVDRAVRALKHLQREGAIDEAQRRAGTEQVREAAADLAAWRRGEDPCRDDRLSLALSGSPERPDAYAAEHLRGQLDQAVAELHDAFGGKGAWWNRVEAVRLTTNVDASCRTRAALADSWSALRGAHPGMTPGAWFTLAIADDRGRLVELVAPSANPWYHGPELPGASTTAGQGPRELGSVAKVLAAVLAGRAGDAPTDSYVEMPRRRAGGRPYVNFGGGRGDSGRTLTAREAFARSNNLAVLWRLHQSDIDPDDMWTVVTGFGFAPREEDEGRARRELPESLALGTAEGTPRDMHRLVQTLGLALRGGPVEPTACTPHLVDGVRLRGGHDWTPVARPWAGCGRAVESLLGEPRERRFVREVLSAVVEPGGSASRALGEFSATGSSRVAMHFAKTGTVGAAGGVTRLSNVAGAIEIDGRLYSYVLQVGPPTAGHLGRRMTGGSAASLLVPALHSLLAPGGPS